MSNIYKKIKISWTYPIQPTSLQVGTVKIYRGTSEFTLDNVLSQVELVSREYDPTFTSFTDDFELEYNVTYYYMIIVYGDINPEILAATSLYSISIENSEIPLNEIHFTTIRGRIGYVGTQGDQIFLSNGTIIDIPVTNQTYSFNIPAGTHKVKLVESVDRHNYVSIGGEVLVELHNFPTLSTVTKFNFATNNHTYLSNLTKVPSVLPSNITDISYMFTWANSFNQDISMWNMSHVTNMSGMFLRAFSFNQDINRWDVSNVTDMSRMFFEATSFNQPLNNWNVSNVNNMNSMFGSAQSFNQDLSMWCVSQIPSAPNYFASGANNWILPKPVWGTCPSSENIPDVLVSTDIDNLVLYYSWGEENGINLDTRTSITNPPRNIEVGWDRSSSDLTY